MDSWSNYMCIYIWATPDEQAHNESAFPATWGAKRLAEPQAPIFRLISSTSPASAIIFRRRRSPEHSLATRTTLLFAPSAFTLSRSPAPPSLPLASKTSSGGLSFLSFPLWNWTIIVFGFLFVLCSKFRCGWRFGYRNVALW